MEDITNRIGYYNNNKPDSIEIKSGSSSMYYNITKLSLYSNQSDVYLQIYLSEPLQSIKGPQSGGKSATKKAATKKPATKKPATKKPATKKPY